MRERHIEFLRCPGCRGVLGLAKAHYGIEDRIERGLLRCQDCRAAYPITGYIPRFVVDEGYAEGFGLEWNVALESGGWLVSDQVKISLEVEVVDKAAVAA